MLPSNQPGRSLGSTSAQQQQESPRIPELTPSAAPFLPSLTAQAPPLPAPRLLRREQSWLSWPTTESSGDAAASAPNQDDGGWQQAREAFHAARGARSAGNGEAGVGETPTQARQASAEQAFDLHHLRAGLPSASQGVRPPNPSSSPPSFSFDPWAPQPRDAPAPSSAPAPSLPPARSPFHTSTPAIPSRPQTYPPTQQVDRPPFSHDLRATAPPQFHDAQYSSRERHFLDRQFVVSPTPYQHHLPLHPSYGPPSDWHSSPASSAQGSGYPYLSPETGVFRGSSAGYGSASLRPDHTFPRRSSTPSESRRPLGLQPPLPRQRQQSFESGGPLSSVGLGFPRSSYPHAPQHSIPPPLADRQPFLSAPSPSNNAQQQQQHPQSSSRAKLRSGLPERSTYAMWVGNVPADATEGELWIFFNQRPPLLDDKSPLDSVTGIESLHLIARSNCAFVNFISNEHLHHAIAQANGIPLRPSDRKCKPLVCRVRMREDDAKSGVGAQRGGGLHKAYVKALQSEAGAAGEVEGSAERVRSSSPSASSSSSTTSDLFAEHFPKRYFILKAHDVFSLEESIRTGLWSTQGHNEAVLDQAYRTSTEGVYIFFSANKSGSWAGYARMAGPIFSQDGAAPLPVPSTTLPLHEALNSLQIPSGLPSPSAESVSPISPSSANLSPLESTGSSESSLQRPTPSRAESGGIPFRVGWLRTDPLPFVRTKQILNSFNSGREVKISRDGTEVEPMAGEQLIQEFWRDLHPATSPLGSTFNLTHSSPGAGPPLPSNRGRRPSRTTVTHHVPSVYPGP